MQGLERRTELEKNFIRHNIGQIRIEQQVIQNWREAQITNVVRLSHPGVQVQSGDLKGEHCLLAVALPLHA